MRYKKLQNGDKIGKLIVVEPTNRSIKHSGTLWKAICACGNETTITANQFNFNKKLSCGCLRIEQMGINAKSRLHETLKNRVVSSLKSNVKRNHGGTVLEWCITDDDAFTLSQHCCYYCGSPPQNTAKVTYGEIRYNGIDRINNAIGYVKNNIAPCCWQCNRAKGDMHFAEFIAWIKQVMVHIQAHTVPVTR
jgi:hypothetical protein